MPGVSMKAWTSLSTLTVGAEILMYGSYGILVDLSKVGNEIPYLSSSFVLCTEILKLWLCLLLLWPDFKAKKLPTITFWHSLPFALPALCYCINNNLAVFMQTQMDPSTYMILGNVKILSTAVIYRIIMRKSVTCPQWMAICLLTTGAAINRFVRLLQIWETLMAQHLLTAALKAKSLSLSEIHITWIGLGSLCCYSLISGFAGVITEYILKQELELSLHFQNALLYIFGVNFNFLAWLMQAYDKKLSSKSSQYYFIFQGYSSFTWALIVTQAATGLIMALIMKHFNNIVRLFIIATAPLVTTLLSLYLFNLQIHAEFLLSAAIILTSVILYNYETVCQYYSILPRDEPKMIP